MKRIFTTTVAAMLVIAMTVSVMAAFSDVGSSAWYASSVAQAEVTGMMSGTGNGTFSPEGTLSRGMMAQILWNAAGKPQATQAAAFTDVSSGAWYANAIAWATQEGIANGYGATFGPDDAVTREQTASMLYRFAQKAGKDTAATAALTAFSDNTSVSSWAVDAMKWAVGAGIFAGNSDGTLHPGQSTTRAQMAKIVVTYMTITESWSQAQQSALNALTAGDAGTTTGGTTGGASGGITPPATSYDVTYDLTGVKCSTSADTASGKFTATLSGETGNASWIKSVKITMDGENITGSAYHEETGKITIAAVTGNVVITAAAYAGAEVEDEQTLCTYLNEITDNYAAAWNGITPDDDVKACFDVLVETVDQALLAHNKGTFLSESFISTSYEEEIASVKNLYKGFDAEQLTQFENVGAGLARISHLYFVLNYFGIDA